MKRLIKPTLVLLTLAVLVPMTALILYETGNLPYKVYVIHTGSMYPTIPPKSAVVVEEHQYQVGQAVSFTVHGETITHRLVAINPNGTITTKGDGNRTDDPWHPPASSIIGGVVAAPHLVGYMFTYVKNPEGFASIFVGLVCLWLIWSIAKEVDSTSTDQTES